MKPLQSKKIIFFTIILAIGLSAGACEGPEGPQGPQGEQGPEGPVGPAGEGGSMIYAGDGPPDADIGNINDYYLNQNTGELYGPKTDDGWGEPGIVLKGEDGQDGADGQDGQNGADGQDGQDGADGEDGSQIHSGSGAPAGSLGKMGDFYLDKSSYELYGPKTGSGWGSPLNLKGADGNANVTRYIFPGHDFGGTGTYTISCVELNNEQEMLASAWLYYLRSSGDIYYSVPGFGESTDQYLVNHTWGGGSCGSRHIIQCKDGSCSDYEEIHIVHIEASNTEDHTKRAGDNIIPDHLDVSNYEEVAEYYGFGGDQ